LECSPNGFPSFFCEITISPLFRIFSGKKEAEAKRAEATERAAKIFLALKRGGDDTTSVTACCDKAAQETGFPRPAESSVRRVVSRLMTKEEKQEKANKDAKSDKRALATRRAADIYRQNNDHTGDVVISVTKCCERAEAELGIRPAESSVRRVLTRLYKDAGMEQPKPKRLKSSPPAKGKGTISLGDVQQPTQQIDPAYNAAGDAQQPTEQIAADYNIAAPDPTQQINATDYTDPAPLAAPVETADYDLSAFVTDPAYTMAAPLSDPVYTMAPVAVNDPTLPPLPPPDVPDIHITEV